MADRKTNLLVTMVFDENSDMQKQVDAEIDFKDEIVKDLRHLVKCRKIKHFIIADDTVINEKLNADVIPIPDGATNGDVFIPMFPDLKIEDNIGSIYMHDDNGIALVIDKKWLNAPYKRGRKNETCQKSRQVQKVRDKE
ncbi:hypothetical protein SAMN05216391_10923 [Lachnospiraceae bacterium KHCPX20]|nr:hypothetical protein SAMN05216391_10923 [Lachnospiraceae bacterium KHCPX20]